LSLDQYPFEAGHAPAAQFDVAGETLWLLAARAVYWPREKMLIVADIHFGKAASFRALGVPVPHGTTAENLAGLDALLTVHDIGHIVFLGDFLHARTARAPATMARLVEWRACHRGLRLTLIRGNHDTHAGDPPALLGIDAVDEPASFAPFAFCHHPDLPPDLLPRLPSSAPAYVLAGHVHPVYHLRSRRDTVRLPCFLAGRTRLLLPSFGAFTGGFPVTPDTDEAVFLTTGDAIFTL
jgi:DNA ligase-associated metallophosphoesterase